MSIVACLAFYDEPPAFLHRCVKSLHDIADHVVAYDGGWDLFPGATSQSNNQAAAWGAITAAAKEADIGYTLYAPDTAWASQVEKRAALMAEAREYGDWLLVIDGDEHIHQANSDQLRNMLQATSADVATVTCRRTTGYEGVNTPQRIRRIYRASTGVTVDTAHNGYRTADGRWLHGDSAAVRLEKPYDASSLITLHHERLNRGEQRNRRALDYRSARMRLRAEDWRGRRAA